MYLYAENIAPYEVTEEDVVWFLRAVDAEGAIETEVAATLLNGFCFTRSRGQPRTLTGFIRDYAQPVNSRWYITGDLFLNSLKNLSDQERAKAEQVALNRERILSTKTSFSLVTEKAVVAALSGLVKIPKNATDYAAPYIDAAKKQYKPLSVSVAGRNRLWARGGAQNWQGYSVEPLQVPAWLKSLASVKIERAFDRDFSTELSKISEFFAENASGYSNKKRQIAFGEIRLNVGEASNYSTDYSVALVQRAANERITSFARSEQMQQASRKDMFAAATQNNDVGSDHWNRRVSNLRRAMSTPAKPLVIKNALGFDFTTGTWTVTDHGEQV
jgi:hypothetical protein